MDAPGEDIEQLTGMVAGGAQIVLFTEGGHIFNEVFHVANGKLTKAEILKHTILEFPL